MPSNLTNARLRRQFPLPLDHHQRQKTLIFDLGFVRFSQGDRLGGDSQDRRQLRLRAELPTELPVNVRSWRGCFHGLLWRRFSGFWCRHTAQGSNALRLPLTRTNCNNDRISH